MQKITIIGNIGRDAENKIMNGQTNCTFSVCVTETYKSDDGSKTDRSQWYNCIFGRTNLTPYLKKGDKVYLEGELRAKIYKDKENRPQIDLTVSVARVELITPKKPESEQ